MRASVKSALPVAAKPDSLPAMLTIRNPHLRSLRFLAAFLAVSLAGLFTSRAETSEANRAEAAWKLDHRYAPPSWQTAICLPDDWQKTLVGKDGALLYDYPGKFAGFGTKITFSLEGEIEWVKQELTSPRVPIVRTLKRAGDVEITEEAFAVAPAIVPKRREKSGQLVIERVGQTTGQTAWAKPPRDTAPAFADVAIGWNAPIEYRFKAPPSGRFTVIFGLCEGWHTNAGQRVLDLQIEGRTRRTVDLVKEKGRNEPALFAFDAQDENGDGWIDLAVATAANSPDKNTILNVLWVFRTGTAPALNELRAGRSARSELAQVSCGTDEATSNPPRHDLMLVTLRNIGPAAVEVRPKLVVESRLGFAALRTAHEPVRGVGSPGFSRFEAPGPPEGGTTNGRLVESVSGMSAGTDHRRVLIGQQTTLSLPEDWETLDQSETRWVVNFSRATLPPRSEKKFAFVVARGAKFEEIPGNAAQAESFRKRAEKFWQKLDLPYDRLVVPDQDVQAQLDSCIRNIYQAREIKKGLPAFQVGPTCYRGLWVVDGSFLLEAITYLGRANETRAGVKYLMSFQRDDGGIMLIDGHWKETGIALWAITRHARLTGDKTWLREVWPKVERGFAYIGKMRQMPAADVPNANLIPDGFSDGGLADKVPEYTNIYWTLAGMRAAVEAARWLGNAAQAEAWQKEYDDFYATFRRAAERDTKSDSHGNRYVPIRMAKGDGVPPQKAQWGFLHSVFPGRIFAADDPLVQGNMAMLKACERQGLVFDTGWLKDGIWTYFGGFYGEAWLWLGDGDKAARTLYAFGNHASPLLCWREEQMPVGKGSGVVGDMPHNWASAEFIRLTRNCLALERGNELHLFEGFPAAWARSGALTKMQDIATKFGPLSLEFRVSKDGREGELKLTPPRRTPPERIVWHLDHWSGQTGTIELPVSRTVTHKIQLGPGLSR